MIKQIKLAIDSLRKTKPLILSLTNYVTMDFVANSMLALGSKPIMSVCEIELMELVKISDAVYINIGTLYEKSCKRCDKAIEYAKEYNKPLILDPVGSGASLLRTQYSRDIIQYMDVVKGNSSEIMSLVDDKFKTSGVESNNTTEQAQDYALILSKEFNTTVVVTGVNDLIIDETRKDLISFGSPVMSLVTGMGCSLGAVIASFRSVIPDSFEASKIATMYFGLCGNLAEATSMNPGSFRSAFIDELYKCDLNSMEKILELNSMEKILELNNR